VVFKHFGFWVKYLKESHVPFITKNSKNSKCTKYKSFYWFIPALAGSLVLEEPSSLCLDFFLMETF
jgi:hypothetical protein